MVYTDHNKTVAVVQARMGSTRLPGKVARQFSSGLSMLQLLIRRLKRCSTLDSIVIAYPYLNESQPIARIAAVEGVLTSGGSEHDVLDRFYKAALGRRAGIVARVCADNPLTDPVVIDRCVEEFHAKRPDYLIPAGVPLGTFAEIMSMNALQHAWDNATDPGDREHVTPFIRRDKKNLTHSELRWPPARWIHDRLTVDTEADFNKVDAIIRRSGGDGVWISLEDLKT